MAEPSCGEATNNNVILIYECVRMIRINKKNRGQVLLVTAVFFTLISLSVMVGVVGPVVSGSRSSQTLRESKTSYILAESVLDDATYRLKTGKTIGSSDAITLNGQSATATIETTTDGKTVTAEGNVDQAVRSLQSKVTVGAGASFNFGMQADTGGIAMENNSSVSGNVYANGPITGANSNLVQGNAISAGPSGLVSGLHATGTAYAHTITNSTIDGDAYYQSLSVSVIGGTKHPGSLDQATTSLPISDNQVAAWENAATTTTITSPCPYKITNTATIGPAKINCDLEISGNNYTLTLTGPVWVTGNINIKNGPTIKVDPSLGNEGVALIADNPSDRLTSSQIILDNSSTFFQGSGGNNSYIIMISQNKGAETGGSEVAIDVGNSASGALLVYAGHGEVLLHNSVALKQVSAYLIRLQNYANVTYETGLISALFNTGPSGGWHISSWGEIP